MPYVPSKKTDGESTDREVIDVAVEAAARKAVSLIKKNNLFKENNLSLIKVYADAFADVAATLRQFLMEGSEIEIGDSPEERLAKVIFGVAEKYGYEGAYLGELNYAVTRFIQRVPQIEVELGQWKEELRYWLYAATVEGLMIAYSNTLDWGFGMAGVFMDIKDEYKRRVNPAYEAAQIVKSGDCYDTPYYNRLVEVVDENGKHIGYVMVDMKRSEETLHVDVLDGHLVFVKKPPKK